MHLKQLDLIKKEIEEQDKEIITEKLELKLLESEYFDNLGFL
jgi:ubiquitin thioesterase protein OTUB1